jgi:septum formation protein
MHGDRNDMSVQTDTKRIHASLEAAGVQTVLLASGSPQRSAILTQLGVPFRVLVPHADELESGDPVLVCIENARRKAAAGALEMRDDELLLAVDTIVVLDGQVYGKPRDEAHARELLTMLRGRTHTVYGGMCLQWPGGGQRRVVAATHVTFRDFPEQALADYLAGGEWAGRAGGYAIQGTGAAFVASISGCYQNVVGLPVALLLSELERGEPDDVLLLD